MRKLLKTPPKITFSEPLECNEFAFVDMVINGEKTLKCVINNSNSLILRKAGRVIKEIKTIHIKILKKYEKL